MSEHGFCAGCGSTGGGFDAAVRPSKPQQAHMGGVSTVEIGEVTTLPHGSEATVENVGTRSHAVLNFGLPEGAPGADGITSVNGQTGEVQLTARDVGAQPVEADGSIVVQKQVKVLNANGNGGGIVMVADGNPGDMRVHFHDAVAYSSPVRLSNLEEPESPNDAVTYMFMDKFVRNAVASAGYVDVTEAYAASGIARPVDYVSTLADGQYQLKDSMGDVFRFSKVTASGTVWIEELQLQQEFYYYTRYKDGKVVDYLSPQEERIVKFGGMEMATKKDVEDALAGVEGGGSGESNVVVVEAIPDTGLSMTVAEIYAAKQAGKAVILCGTEPENALLLYAEEDFAVFGGPKGTKPGRMVYTIVDDNNVFFDDSFTAQSVANLVTTLSEDSTDEQYPSAKAVYKALQNAGGGGGWLIVTATMNDDGVMATDRSYSEIMEAIMQFTPVALCVQGVVLTFVTVNPDGQLCFSSVVTGDIPDNGMVYCSARLNPSGELFLDVVPLEQGGGGIVTVTTTHDLGNDLASMTAEEIYSAYLEGNYIIMRSDLYGVLPLRSAYPGNAEFSSTTVYENIQQTNSLHVDDNGKITVHHAELPAPGEVPIFSQTNWGAWRCSRELQDILNEMDQGINVTARRQIAGSWQSYQCTLADTKNKLAVFTSVTQDGGELVVDGFVMSEDGVTKFTTPVGGSGGGGGGSGTVVVQLTWDEAIGDYGQTMPATEIYDAVQAGKTVLLEDNGLWFHLHVADPTRAYFLASLPPAFSGGFGWLTIDADGNCYSENAIHYAQEDYWVEFWVESADVWVCDCTLDELFDIVYGGQNLVGYTYDFGSGDVLRPLTVADGDNGRIVFSAVIREDGVDVVDGFEVTENGVTHFRTPVGGGGTKLTVELTENNGVWTSSHDAISIRMADDAGQTVEAKLGLIHLPLDFQNGRSAFFTKTIVEGGVPTVYAVTIAGSDVTVTTIPLATAADVGNAATALAAMDGIIGGDA